MKGKWISVVIAAALVAVAFGALPAPRALAAGTISYYPANIAKDAVFNTGTTPPSLTSGTPFAVYATITGAPASANCTGPKVRLLPTLTGGTADASFRTWTSSANGWLTDSGAWASFPSIVTDASGNWSGWGYGAVPATAANTYVEVRINCSGTNYSTTRVQITLLDMTTAGGWLEETIGSPRAGRAIAVKNGSSLIGMYVAEDNSVSEGYPATTAGYLKVAVPDCATCNYTIESWDLTAPGTPVGQINTMGAGSCPNTISVGGTTSLDACNVPTAVSLRTLTAGAPLSPLAAALPVVGLAVAGALIARRRRSA